MKIKHSAIIIFSAFLSASVMAENPRQFGDIITQSVDLVFNENVKLNFTLTPEQNLRAGKVSSNTKIASFAISATPAARVGVRFTPNTGFRVNAGQYRIDGKDNAEHKIYIYLPVTRELTYLAEGDWILPKTKKPTFTGDIKTHGDQDIPADTYVLSMDASVFIS